MATISEMLLGNNGGLPEGDLGAARKLVEDYKKMIEDYPKKYHSYCTYEIGDMIGYCDYSSFESAEKFISFECERVCFDSRLVNEEQLNYCLRKEGLRAEKMKHGKYEGCVCIFIC